MKYWATTLGSLDKIINFFLTGSKIVLLHVEAMVSKCFPVAKYICSLNAWLTIVSFTSNCGLFNYRIPHKSFTLFSVPLSLMREAFIFQSFAGEIHVSHIRLFLLDNLHIHFSYTLCLHNIAANLLLCITR